MGRETKGVFISFGLDNEEINPFDTNGDYSYPFLYI